MKTFQRPQFVSLLTIAMLAGCSASSVTGTGLIDPSNPIGNFQAVSADGVNLPAQHSAPADASGVVTTLQLNSSSLTLVGDGTLAVGYAYTLTRTAASGAVSTQGFVSNYIGTWGYVNGRLQLTLSDPNSDLVVQTPATATPTNISVTTDFNLLIGVDVSLNIRYQ